VSDFGDTGSTGQGLPSSGVTQQELLPEPGSVPAARRFVLNLGWARDQETNHRLGTLVSELVTNAILHARTPFVVKVNVDGDVIRVSVTDGDYSQPVIKQHEPLDPTGRGLRIVEAMANRWGVNPENGGKTVWFELERLPRPA
jgi:anti-sigma regulatory factor (Ser/Thr protein kinase)